MATVIKLKRSGETGSVPTTGDLVTGEVALNTADEKLYVLNAGGSVVELFNGLTGATGPTGPAGAAGAAGAKGNTGATGPVGTFVESWNTLTGVVDVTGSKVHFGGVSADFGVTASQYNLGWTNIPFSSASIADGAMFVHDGDTDVMQKWVDGAKTTIGFILDGDGAAITTGAKIDALRQIDQYWTIEKVRLYCQNGVAGGDTTTINLYKTTNIEQSATNIHSGATILTINGSTTIVSIAPEAGTDYETSGSAPSSGTFTLSPGDWIYPNVQANSSEDKIVIFVELKATTT